MARVIASHRQKPCCHNKSKKTRRRSAGNRKSKNKGYLFLFCLVSVSVRLAVKTSHPNRKTKRVVCMGVSLSFHPHGKHIQTSENTGKSYAPVDAIGTAKPEIAAFCMGGGCRRGCLEQTAAKPADAAPGHARRAGAVGTETWIRGCGAVVRGDAAHGCRV